MRPPISKITRAKWTGGVAQVVEHLLCECKALSSNSNPTKRLKEMIYNKYLAVILMKRKKSAQRIGSNAKLFPAWP
jgi:hypothetical protein